MKRSQLSCVVGAALLLLAAAGAGAQDASFFNASSAHYRVMSDVGSDFSRDISRKMEAALTLYNEYLRFDLSATPTLMRVRIFRSKNDYDRYLMGLISETRSDFVFVAYRDPGRSELLGFQNEAEDFDASLLHYGFIQFLNSRIPGAPLWLEEGLATYLEESEYDPAANKFVLLPNFAWLDSFKAILNDRELSSRFSVDDLLRLDREAAAANIEVFYPAAWGMAHFLLESPDRRFNRILWDSISALDPAASVLENSKRAKQKAFSWITPGELQQVLGSYILSLKTFNDLVREGADHYGRKDLEQARQSFENAAAMRRNSYIPAYYLGLIAYQDRRYDEASRYYAEAQRLGVNPALVNYALGVNAFADQDFDLAVGYLNRARELDPGGFAEKATDVLKRIEVMR